MFWCTPKIETIYKNTPIKSCTLVTSDFNGDGNLDVVTTFGLLTDMGTDSSSVLLGDGMSDATITFTGTLSNINNTLEGLNFVLNANYIGATSLTITTDDQTHLNDTDTIAIAVALVGTNGNDSIYGTVGDDIIYGLVNNTIFGNEGLNVIDNGDGNDLILGGSQADIIYDWGSTSKKL